MVNRIEKIRSRFGSSWSGWNNPLRAKVLSVILLLVVVGASIYLQGVLAHQGITFFEQNYLLGNIVSAVFMLTLYLVGMAVLALVD